MAATEKTLGSTPVRPIIIIKKKVSGGGHHGGSWKVAYADFVTAMMSLFIVLWLLNSTPQVKKSVAGYFNDPRSNGKETGTEETGTGSALPIDRNNVEALKQTLEKAMNDRKDLKQLSNQVEMTITGEGLKIELLEGKNGTFFESGSPQLNNNGNQLLQMIAGQLKPLPNSLLIEGHTDAQPFSQNATYSNWELSADRANSARRNLEQAGVPANRVSQVRGYADQSLRTPKDPYNPANRRISLIVKWADGAPPAITLPSATSPTPAAQTTQSVKPPTAAK